MPADEIVVDKEILDPGEFGLGEYNMDQFVSACQKPLDPKYIKQKKISIKEPDNLEWTTLSSERVHLNDLSFKISKEDVVGIVNQILKITINPLRVASLLQGFDVKVGSAINDQKIKFPDNFGPQYLIVGNGTFIPGPRPENCPLVDTKGLLDKVLLANEQIRGINEKGVPKIVGYQSRGEINKLVRAGYIFTEARQISRMLLHGGFTHRLMFAALFHAAETGELDLQYGDAKVLTPQQLLELLVLTDYQLYPDHIHRVSLWDITVDNVIDTEPRRKILWRDEKDSYNLDDYNFSCRSPFGLNAFFLCFGDSLGLSNIRNLLLNSHWWAADKMVNQIKAGGLLSDIPDSIIYTYCMEGLGIAGNDPQAVGVELPFTQTEFDVRLNSRYVLFNPGGSPYILKKSDSLSKTESINQAIKPLDTSIKLEKLIQDKMQGKKIDLSVTDQDELLNNVIQKIKINFPHFLNLLKSLQPEAQKVFLELLGKERLVSIIIWWDYLNRTLAIFSAEGQSCLIQLLGDSFLKNNIIKNFNLFVDLLKSLQPEAQKVFLELLGKEKLISTITQQSDLNKTLTILSAEGQSCLIQLLGGKFLQKITYSYSILIKILSSLNSDSRKFLLKTLSKDVIVKCLFLSSNSFNNEELLQDTENEMLLDLFQVLGKEPFLTVKQSDQDGSDNDLDVHQELEPWKGYYNKNSWNEFFLTLQDFMNCRYLKERGYAIAVLVSGEGLGANQTINIKYDRSLGWEIINSQPPNPFTMASKNTIDIAEKIFSVFGTDEIIKLSTQFFLKTSVFENCSTFLFEQHQAIAEQQAINVFTILGPQELKKVTPELMQNAFHAKNKKLCRMLIEKGVNFYTCMDKVKTDGILKNKLFNELCEAQAKFNIDKLKKAIFTKKGEVEVGGKSMPDSEYRRDTEIPKTVEVEWQECEAAQEGKKTYYEAWTKIIELRKNANYNENRLFPISSENASTEPSILALKLT